MIDYNNTIFHDGRRYVFYCEHCYKKIDSEKFRNHLESAKHKKQVEYQKYKEKIF